MENEELDEQVEVDEEPVQSDDVDEQVDDTGEPNGDPSPEPEPETESEEPQRQRTVTPLSLPGVSDDERESLNNLLGEDGAPLVMGLIDKIVSQRMQGFATANAHYMSEAVRAPEFFSEYGPEVQQAMATLPSNVQGTKAGMETATMMAIGMRAMQSGDLPSELIRAGELMSKTRPGGTRQQPDTGTRLNVSPGTRTPSSSVSTQAARQTVRDEGNPLSKLNKVWGNGKGLTKAQERAIMEEVG